MGSNTIFGFVGFVGSSTQSRYTHVPHDQYLYSLGAASVREGRSRPTRGRRGTRCRCLPSFATADRPLNVEPQSTLCFWFLAFFICARSARIIDFWKRFPAGLIYEFCIDLRDQYFSCRMFSLRKVPRTKTAQFWPHWNMFNTRYQGYGTIDLVRAWAFLEPLGDFWAPRL